MDRRRDAGRHEHGGMIHDTASACLIEEKVVGARLDLRWILLVIEGNVRGLSEKNARRAYASHGCSTPRARPADDARHVVGAP